MLIAEIRHKLPTHWLGETTEEDVRQALALEDMLTADVFGALKYLPRRPYLEAVLHVASRGGAQAATDRAGTPPFIPDAHRVRFLFWPNYPTPVGLSRETTQPDVVLEGDRSFVVVEAKLRSGFGPQQMESELLVALHEAGRREAYLLLVTRSLPRIRIAGRKLLPGDYLRELPGNELEADVVEVIRSNAHRVLCITWTGILVALEAAHKHHRAEAGEAPEVQRADDIISDLRELLALRHLEPFRGLAFPAVIAPGAQDRLAATPRLGLRDRYADSFAGFDGLAGFDDKQIDSFAGFDGLAGFDDKQIDVSWPSIPFGTRRGWPSTLFGSVEGVPLAGFAGRWSLAARTQTGHRGRGLRALGQEAGGVRPVHWRLSHPDHRPDRTAPLFQVAYSEPIVLTSVRWRLERTWFAAAASASVANVRWRVERRMPHGG